MARVSRGVQAHAKHKKVLKKAKGYYGARSKVYRVAKQAVIKAGQYAYRDRRQRRRQFREFEGLLETRDVRGSARCEADRIRRGIPEEHS